MESATHHRLKQLSLAFLREHGCRAAATEVSCPISRYRVDVAGYADGPAGATPSTVVIECKQARSDFMRETRDREVLLRRREELVRFRRAYEERLRREEPWLRRAGTSLFPELDDWDFAATRQRGYRRLERQLRRVDAMLHGQTKFYLIARYRLADRLYLAAPRGLIAKREVPPGWGLLECADRDLDPSDDPQADLFGESRLSVKVAAPPLEARPERRHRLLRNIAVTASARACRAMGVL